jgi:anhydro-N-acetylmuramic acid kinase
LIVLGLMSGTSLDGIDAAVVELEEVGDVIRSWELRGFATRPYSADERDRLGLAMTGSTAAALCRLRVDLSAWAAEAARAACDVAGLSTDSLALVGSHGQTIWHLPPRGGVPGASLQLGDPAALAAHLGAPVVSDFRSADLAAGGQGAPLVPWADRVLFSHPTKSRALQNLGGMGNVTWLPPEGATDPCLAFDTGPGVALLDRVAFLASRGGDRFDRGGRLAESGRADPILLDRLMQIPFFDQPPPRSTGREVFGDELVDSLVSQLGLEPGSGEPGWGDLMATLVSLTARSIGDAYRRWLLPRPIDGVYLMGGGGRNLALHRAIASELAPIEVCGGAELGIDPDAREAVAFALLGWAHRRGIPANVPEATGATGLRVLGSWTPAPGGSR